MNRKRVVRLMELVGIAAVYPKPRLSQPGEGHKIYPHLLEGVEVTRINQVWSTDITYIRMAGGFLYLAALRQALRRGQPEIFNSDQGSRFTLEKFTGELESRGIAVSMDGCGRCLDNIFIEPLWHPLKYVEVYLRDYARVAEARAGAGRWFRFYPRFPF